MSFPHPIALFALTIGMHESDPSTDAHLQEIVYQRRCMQNTLPLVLFIQFSDGIENPDVCAFRGVRCDGLRRVRHVRWEQLRSITSVSWFPFRLFSLYIRETQIMYSLNVRMLPRNLRKCTIRDANLSGTADLQALPPNIIDLDLSENALKGTVRLTSLPETIETINMSRNAIRLVVVDSAKLPESLQLAVFYKCKGRNWNVRIMGIDGEIDTRVSTVFFVDYEKSDDHDLELVLQDTEEYTDSDAE